ncbi:hypothetical protein VA7868_00522 [Vibrio aerogenes CECT 7868]|uniref:Uncharacterized protein n=1 Tax=Vibrio aerogenes CECT 7868 TaxID=1216006 RepID=A0A1M5VW80_9VIBR|nr:hypothetical protein VA7868_00522 [Vibrio aerogenes CECT 7868]
MAEVYTNNFEMHKCACYHLMIMQTIMTDTERCELDEVLLYLHCLIARDMYDRT